MVGLRVMGWYSHGKVSFLNEVGCQGTNLALVEELALMEKLAVTAMLLEEVNSHGVSELWSAQENVRVAVSDGVGNHD